MRPVIRNTILVVVLLLAAAWSIIPPERQLRLGKDLRGGVSLIYSVMLKPGDPPDVIASVIDVLKSRVDPKGLSEITFRQLGQDRIEVSMPLPNERVKRLKRAFEDELKKLDQASFDPATFERVMRLSGLEREQEIARVSAGDPVRQAGLHEAAAASDAAQAARAELNAAQAALRQAQDQGATPEQLKTLEDAVSAAVERTADAELAYDAARKTAMAASLSSSEVRRALALSDVDQRILDERTRTTEVIPSPQAQSLERLRNQYPGQKAQLEAVLAAYDAYARQRTPLDDPEDLKRLLAASGVLDFRIAVQPGTYMREVEVRRELRERGPLNVSGSDARWYPIDNLASWYDSAQQLRALRSDPAGYFGSRYRLVAEEYDGNYYLLMWDVAGSRLTHAEGEWRVDAAYRAQDQLGRPAIGFTMDTRGASLLGNLTGAHVGKPMAILLDDRVYTAPNLESRISKSGIIQGNFGETELRYITRVLAAGSLQAKLSPQPIGESTVGPDLGLDNLRKGLRAGLIAVVVIGGFMIVYYFGFGLIAVTALLCNGLLLLGMMALNRAAFTMPGIAGVILTFGMAVDANVLIYERVREELKRGADLRNALRLGYSKAMSSIVDGNITNLIVCVVLYYVGTQEIKGFAITMSIGVLTTLFSALVISRLIFTYLVDLGPWRRASMLAIAIPAIDRFFHRDVNWLRLRWIFWCFSAFYVGMGLFFVAYEGRNMLDNEFRGGTQVTLKLTKDLKRQDVLDRVQTAARQAPPLRELETASVLPVDPQDDGVTSSTFSIKTLAQDKDAVMNRLVPAFQDVTEIEPAISFRGEHARNLREAPVHRVVEGVLGKDIDRPQYGDDVKGYIGGIAVVLEDLQPPPRLEQLRERLEQRRTEAAFSDTLSRVRAVRVLEGDESAVRSAVVLVRDPVRSFFENEARFDAEVSQREWNLVRQAITESSSPASIQSFSASIAASFRAQAVVAVLLSFLLIGIYVWVRFGAMNYALAAILPLLHDVLTAVGLVAVAEVLYDWGPAQPIVRSLGILPFKIDLPMIAAFLTIVGYSLNDGIIVMDRIRENRGKLPYADEKAINSAVNQTISRTVITSGTTLFATVILYLFGGEGVRGFAYALSIGIIVGTYSSIAITAPIVWVRQPKRGGGSRPAAQSAASAPPAPPVATGA
jgi:SecD/SecF fusion protein